MMKKLLAVFFLAFWIGPVGRSLAQDSRPYLKAATLYIAADGWVDMYLNGIPIVDSQRTTPESSGPQTIVCIPKHICYFQRENILAMENTNPFPRRLACEKYVGYAYLLRLLLSDGTRITLSSNDVGDHAGFYIASRKWGDPTGWHYLDFNEAGWHRPLIIGDAVPGVARLNDPANGDPIDFLSASGDGYHVQVPGERHLYRRKFFLDISPNPLCESPAQRVSVPSGPPPDHDGPPGHLRFRPSPPPPRRIPPTATFTAVPTPTVFRVWTPTPSPTLVPTLMPSLVSAPWPDSQSTRKSAEVLSLPPTPRPRRAAVTSFTPPSEPAPTATFISVPEYLFVPTPTMPPERNFHRRALPRRTYPAQLLGPWSTPPPYRSVGSGISGALSPETEPSAAVRRPTAVPSPTSGPEPSDDGTQTIAFGPGDANLYVTFADGPGRYRVVVEDAEGNRVKTILDQWEVTGSAWIDWDGKDSNGKDEPPGKYRVLFSRDGKLLNKVVVVKEGNP